MTCPLPHCPLSNVTKSYLDTFYCILETLGNAFTNAELTDSVSRNFIVHLIPHHHAAAEVSGNILKYTTSLPVQNFAEAFRAEQSQHTERLQDLLPFCATHTNTREELCLYKRRMNDLAQSMLKTLSSVCITNNPNMHFLRTMTVFSRTEADMARLTMQYHVYDGLMPVLEEMAAHAEQSIMEITHLMLCGE